MSAYDNDVIEDLGMTNQIGLGWSAASIIADVVLTNLARTARGDSGASVARAPALITGKVHFEIKLDDIDVSSVIALTVGVQYGTSGVGYGGISWRLPGASGGDEAGIFVSPSSVLTTGSIFRAVSGDVLAFSVNGNSGNFWVWLNGVCLGAGDPVTGVAPIAIIPINPSLRLFTPYVEFIGAASQQVTARFRASEWSYPGPAGYDAPLSDVSSSGPSTQLDGINFLSDAAVAEDQSTGSIDLELDTAEDFDFVPELGELFSNGVVFDGTVQSPIVLTPNLKTASLASGTGVKSAAPLMAHSIGDDVFMAFVIDSDGPRDSAFRRMQVKFDFTASVGLSFTWTNAYSGHPNGTVEFPAGGSVPPAGFVDDPKYDFTTSDEIAVAIRTTGTWAIAPFVGYIAVEIFCWKNGSWLDGDPTMGGAATIACPADPMASPGTPFTFTVFLPRTSQITLKGDPTELAGELPTGFLSWSAIDQSSSPVNIGLFVSVHSSFPLAELVGVHPAVSHGLDATSVLHDAMRLLDRTTPYFGQLLEEIIQIHDTATLVHHAIVRVAERMVAEGSALSILHAVSSLLDSLRLIEQADHAQLAVISEAFNAAGGLATIISAVSAVHDSLQIADALSKSLLVIRTAMESVLLDDTGAAGAVLGNLIAEGIDFQIGFGSAFGIFDTWVINTETGAPTRYDGLQFNSYANRRGFVMAASESGLYVLRGDTDAGEDIKASILTGKMGFQSPNMKHVREIFIGYSSTGGLAIKVISTQDGELRERWYELKGRKSSVDGAGRVKLGRGVKSRYWQFELVNQEGSDFEMEQMDFEVIRLTRRVD